jgi:hypothetical protein
LVLLDNVADGRPHEIVAVVQLLAYSCWHAGMPYVQGPSISTRRASTLPAPRTLVPEQRSDGHEPEIGHELSHTGEAATLADFSDDGHCDHQRDPARPLQSGDDWRHWPARQWLLDLPCQSLEPGLRIPDGVNVTLQHDLQRLMSEAHRGQPTAIGQRPGKKSSEDLAREAIGHPRFGDKRSACSGARPALP